MAAVLVLLVALASAQRPLPLSSFQYPSAPLLPIAPIASYGDAYIRRASISQPRVTNVGFIRNNAVSHGYPSSANTDVDPCIPSPCGNNTYCEISSRKFVAICRCLDGFIPDGHTINGCKPQCTRHSECRDRYRCENNKCVEVCSLNACGIGASCIPGRNNEAVCECPPGLTGNPDVGCTEVRIEPVVPIAPLDPCATNPCGFNTHCRSEGHKAVCSCLHRYEGNPLDGCREVECTVHDDCVSRNHACHRSKCVNPCSIPSICGLNTDCSVTSTRQPQCVCKRNYVGNPLTGCTRFDPSTLCNPSPCGTNSICKVAADQTRAECYCQNNHFGDPLVHCRPECEIDSDCPGAGNVCEQNRCVDACKNAGCVREAICDVRNGRAHCRCPDNYLGSPYTRCYPECERHEDCPYNRVCSRNFKCTDPCDRACGINANCDIRDRAPICSCPKTMTGDPFIRCRPFTPQELCEPNPCGISAECNPGHDRDGNDRPVCTCPRGYIGDPLTRCNRGECFSDDECRSDLACYNYRCENTCFVNGKSVCGSNTECRVSQHRPTCSCRPGYEGNPLVSCDHRPEARFVVGRTRRRLNYW